MSFGSSSPLPNSNARAITTLIPAQTAPVAKSNPYWLDSKCLGCHGEDPEDVQGDYDVRTRESLLKGGESGEVALVPGEPGESPLFQAVNWEELEMPPKENDRLTKEQIGFLRDWIKAGAPWPDATVQKQIRAAESQQKVTDEGHIVETIGGLSEDWTSRRYKAESLWAFRPLADVELPSSTRNPIDIFVARKLEQAGLQPSPPADKLTLLRRATFDLLGLPPTPKQVEAFLSDESPQAFANLVDRLLASPRYGERWGQHWLDVVRYADTSGYSNDWERSNAWRYRDYVIRSINDDKPYDRFVLEQIAGDELEPENPEMLVAVGFLRMGPWEHTGMSVAKITRQQYVDDLVNSVGQTFLSTAMRCCKCHDHKFDPIPTKDYYRMYAAFATTQPAERNVPYLDSESTEGFEEGRASVQALLDHAVKEKKHVLEKQEAAAREWYAERGKEYISEAKRNKLPDNEKPPRHYGWDHIDEGTFKVRRQDERIWKRRLQRFQPLAQSVYSGGDLYQQSAYFHKPAKNNKAELSKSKQLPESHIFVGGSVFAPTDSVTPGVLSVLRLATATGTKEDPFQLPAEMSGRRLAMARWIASPDNPLAIRSITNRVWHYHFGKGIAGNPNNFGDTGRKPTHPELLDWLSGWFLENGWSLKKLHRLVMTSETYQQSARHPDMDTLREKDPNNHLLAYFTPRRLPAEELRDGMLAVSGELSLKMGGLPISPEINLEVALQPRMLQSSLAPAYQPSSTPIERNRRSIYAYRVRGQADPFLEVFNQPNPNDSCEMRDASSVTPQVFTLLNSDVITDRSIAFAFRLQQERESLDSQIARAFELAFGRVAMEDEAQQLSAYVKKMVAYHREHIPQPKTVPTVVTRSLVEEFSGLAFEYEEWLNIYATNYVPDKKAWEASPETRALADLCMIVFNAHEFVHVY
ncbi:MAG TPA: PSD1 and planctomycete cytochrome C domain-containing protein [Pirellulaceae bacterium]|nr:PSD1 and planctomycete cytochrome C domain-containing protein [Pirellulaceae bacterium]